MFKLSGHFTLNFCEAYLLTGFFYFTLNHEYYFKKTACDLTCSDRELILFSGIVPGELYWGKFKKGGGPDCKYPVIICLDLLCNK